MNMVELMNKGRIVELNDILTPGEGGRRLALRQRRVFTGEFMYEVDTISHIGAHAEAPSHFIPAMPEGKPAKDISEFAAATFMGEAVFVDLKDLRPGDKINLEFIKQFGIKRGDIVLMGNAPTSGPVGAPTVPAADSRPECRFARAATQGGHDQLRSPGFSVKPASSASALTGHSTLSRGLRTWRRCACTLSSSAGTSR